MNKKGFIEWLPMLVFTAGMLAFFVLPKSILYHYFPFGREIKFVADHFDREAHFISFGLVFFICTQFMHYVWRFSVVKNVIISLIAGCGLGFSTEVVQGFVADRAASTSDVHANIAGTICGIIAGLAIIAVLGLLKKLPYLEKNTNVLHT